MSRTDALRRSWLSATVVLVLGVGLGGCAGAGDAEISGSLEVAFCEDGEPLPDDYRFEPNFFAADYYNVDELLDDGLIIRLQNGTDFSLRGDDALVFVIDDDHTREIAEAVAAGGRAGATFDVSPGGTVNAALRLYGTCPDLFGDFQGVGSITFTRFPAPPDEADDPLRIDMGERLTATFELATITDLRDGGSIGSLSGRFDFVIDRRPGTTGFP